MDPIETVVMITAWNGYNVMVELFWYLPTENPGSMVLEGGNRLFESTRLFIVGQIHTELGKYGSIFPSLIWQLWPMPGTMCTIMTLLLDTLWLLIRKEAGLSHTTKCGTCP